MGVAILIGVQYRQKCLFEIQSQLIELGTHGHAVLVPQKNFLRFFIIIFVSVPDCQIVKKCLFI